VEEAQHKGCFKSILLPGCILTFGQGGDLPCGGNSPYRFKSLPFGQWVCFLADQQWLAGHLFAKA